MERECEKCAQHEAMIGEKLCYACWCYERWDDNPAGCFKDDDK